MSIRNTIHFFIYILFIQSFCIEITNAQEIKTSNLQEKIFVHTDKEVYLAGEILWFKLYCVNASDLHPVLWSKVAYVELISNDSKPVWQGKVSLKPGDKEGSYHLPLSLNSGNYILRAYTSLMKNQGTDYFFQKHLTIINTLKNNIVPVRDTALRYSIQFFPEGGKLINGASTKIGFKILDSYGRGVNGKGYILTGPADTLLAFKSFKFGMGHFKFTPFADVRYRAIVILDNGNLITSDLPKIYDHGFVMNVNLLHDQYIIDVRSNSSNEEQDLYLITHSTDGKEMKSIVHLENAAAHISISKKSLGVGVITCTLLDGNRNPLCERLLFNHPDIKDHVEIKTDQKAYGVREPVKLYLDHNDGKMDSTGDYSVSVWKIDSISQGNQTDIANYFLFSSELKGNIDSIEYYFRKSDPEVDEATENLLLTQGWRTFRDPDHVSKPELPTYPLEYNGQIVQVKVTDSRTNQPAENIQTFLSVPGTNFRFYSVASDKNGIARFELPELYGYNEIIVQTNTQQDSFYHVELLSPFAREGIDKLPPFSLKAI